MMYYLVLDIENNYRIPFAAMHANESKNTPYVEVSTTKR